ncbi:MAG TPA: alpha/beta hydrolase [Thermoanaerobaculia bacterium]|nr:alpha/beta hydrolase [Thermoanaerobaculia bacterium]
MTRRLMLAFSLAVAASLPASERLVDVGTHKLFVRQEGTRGPTVVFESGMNQTIASWDKVIPEVAKFARVVAYDRAGYGKSEASPEAPVAREVARELHTLLARIHAKPPYVLVGHSLGGTYIRVFSSMYPKEVAGFVFADAAMVWRLNAFMRRDFSNMYWEGEREWAENREKLPPAKRLEYAAITVSEEQARAAWPLPRVPAIVITGARPHGMFEKPEDDQRYIDGWVQIHREELVDKLPGSKHVILPDTGHMIPTAKPEAIIDAVREVITPPTP